MKLLPFPRFTTQRLVIRQMTDTDDKAMSVLRSDEHVNQYIQRAGKIDKEDALAFIHKMNGNITQNQVFFWAICLKDDPELIGTICLWNISADGETAEVGYDLMPAFHRQGIMSEALACVIDYSFAALGFNMLEAITHKDNKASIQLLEKHNFKLEPNRKFAGNADFIIYTLEAKR